MVQHVAQDTLARRWATELERWAIPDDILARAPQSPWSFDPQTFRATHEMQLNHTHHAMLEMLSTSAEHSVLDVGAGAGAGVIPIGSAIRSLLALDQNGAMLEVLLADSEAIPNMRVETRVGDFFELEPELGLFDVVTSQNVIYNIADLFGFLEGLLAHARAGIVLEFTLHHPHYGLNLLWERFHQLKRPTTPNATDVIEALELLGAAPKVFIGGGLRRQSDPARRLISTRNRLCLGPDEDQAIQAALDEGYQLPNPAVTVVCGTGDA